MWCNFSNKQAWDSLQSERERERENRICYMFFPRPLAGSSVRSQHQAGCVHFPLCIHKINVCLASKQRRRAHSVYLINFNVYKCNHSNENRFSFAPQLVLSIAAPVLPCANTSAMMTHRRRCVENSYPAKFQNSNHRERERTKIS